MKIVETRLRGVVIVEPKVFGDARGFFVETFRETWLGKDGLDTTFVQDNHSRSARGVLRGLHYQTVNPQGKLVRVVHGSVFDVAVDVRHDSPNFGQWVGVVLDDIDHRQLWIPPGFAHGFCVLSDCADFAYKCTSYYDPASDTGIRWDDPSIGIEWPAPEPGTERTLSEKDRALPALADQPVDRLPTSIRVAA